MEKYCKNLEFFSQFLNSPCTNIIEESLFFFHTSNFSIPEIFSVHLFLTAGKKRFGQSSQNHFFFCNIINWDATASIDGIMGFLPYLQNSKIFCLPFFT